MVVIFALRTVALAVLVLIEALARAVDCWRATIEAVDVARLGRYVRLAGYARVCTLALTLCTIIGRGGTRKPANVSVGANRTGVLTSVAIGDVLAVLSEALA